MSKGRACSNHQPKPLLERRAQENSAHKWKGLLEGGFPKELDAAQPPPSRGRFREDPPTSLAPAARVCFAIL